MQKVPYSLPSTKTHDCRTREKQSENNEKIAVTMNTTSAYQKTDSDISNASDASAAMMDEAYRRVGHRLSQRVGGDDSSSAVTVDSLGDHPKSAFAPPTLDHDRIRSHAEVRGVILIGGGVFLALKNMGSLSGIGYSAEPSDTVFPFLLLTFLLSIHYHRLAMIEQPRSQRGNMKIMGRIKSWRAWAF